MDYTYTQSTHIGTQKINPSQKQPNAYNIRKKRKKECEKKSNNKEDIYLHTYI